MNNTLKLRRRHVLLVAGLILLTGWLFIPANSFARYRVKSVLLSDRSADEQLRQLERYVRIGDENSTVNRRLSPRPDQDVAVKGPAWHSYGLGDVNLELAIEADGSIIAIGRLRYAIDDQIDWLTPPPTNW